MLLLSGMAVVGWLCSLSSSSSSAVVAPGGVVIWIVPRFERGGEETVIKGGIKGIHGIRSAEEERRKKERPSTTEAAPIKARFYFPLFPHILLLLLVPVRKKRKVEETSVTNRGTNGKEKMIFFLLAQ